ncbi:MAG TPA: hypothetical protein VK452_02615 [Dissulfurispiraceae bacterium]|nr:hypothetical protein [Dissulfurispiraceae bacterium]
MATSAELTGLGRLEDFISFAKTGSKINASVDLNKRPISQKVHPGNSEEMNSELDMYLLIADYKFKVGGDSRMVSKVYLLGSSAESIDESKVQVNIANARLKEDYNRLKNVNISFEERFF